MVEVFHRNLALISVNNITQGAHLNVKNTEKTFRIKDRYQWWGHEFRHSLSLDMDKLFPKAIIYVLYH